MPWKKILLALSLTFTLTAFAAEPKSLDDLVAEGQRLLGAQDCSGAIKVFRQAEKLSPPTSSLLSDTSRAYACFGAWKDAENYARRAVEAATTAPEKAEAANRLGQTLFRNGAATEAGYKDAANAFREAVTVSEGKLAIARFNLGMTLLKLGQDAEGVPLLQAFVEEFPQAPGVELARSYIENPLRARVPMLPDFELTTLDGAQLNSKDLKGKVVLLDFWATWCAPCRLSIPEIRRWAKKHAADPLVVVSVTTERDEALVKRFISEEKMSWPQIQDRDRFFDQQLNVTGLPTYVLVDHQGVIVHRASGWDLGISSALSSRINKAIKAAKKAKPAS